MRPYGFTAKLISSVVLISFLTGSVAWTEPSRRAAVEREKGPRFALAPEQMTKKESPKRIQALVAQREALNEIFDSAYATVAKDLAAGKKIEQINADIQRGIAAKIEAYKKTPGKKVSYTVLTDRIGVVVSEKDPKKIDHMIVPFKMGNQYYAFIVRNEKSALDENSLAVLRTLPAVMDYSQPDKTIAVEIRNVPVNDAAFESWVNAQIAKVAADPAVPAEVKEGRLTVLKRFITYAFMVAMLMGLQGCFLDHRRDVEMAMRPPVVTAPPTGVTPEVQPPAPIPVVTAAELEKILRREEHWNKLSVYTRYHPFGTQYLNMIVRDFKKLDEDTVVAVVWTWYHIAPFTATAVFYNWKTDTLSAFPLVTARYSKHTIGGISKDGLIIFFDHANPFFGYTLFRYNGVDDVALLETSAPDRFDEVLDPETGTVVNPLLPLYISADRILNYVRSDTFQSYVPVNITTVTEFKKIEGSGIIVAIVKDSKDQYHAVFMYEDQRANPGSVSFEKNSDVYYAIEKAASADEVHIGVRRLTAPDELVGSYTYKLSDGKYIGLPCLVATLVGKAPLAVAGRPEVLPEVPKGAPVAVDPDLQAKITAVNTEVENLLKPEEIEKFIKADKLPAGVTAAKLVEDLKAALKTVRDEFYAGFNLGSRLIAHADPARGVIEFGEGMVRKADPKRVARVKIHELLHHVLGDANHEIISEEEALRDELLTDKVTVSAEAAGVQAQVAEAVARADKSLEGMGVELDPKLTAEGVSGIAQVALKLEAAPKNKDKPAVVYVTVEPENNLIGLEETLKKLQEEKRQVKIILVGREEYAWAKDLRKRMKSKFNIEFVPRGEFDRKLTSVKDVDAAAVEIARDITKMQVDAMDIAWIASVEDAYQVAGGFKKIPVIKPREKAADQLCAISMQIDVAELAILAHRISGVDMTAVTFAQLAGYLDKDMQKEFLGALEVLGVKTDENVAEALMRMPPTTTVSGKIASDLMSLRSSLIAA